MKRVYILIIVFLMIIVCFDIIDSCYKIDKLITTRRESFKSFVINMPQNIKMYRYNHPR